MEGIGRKEGLDFPFGEVVKMYALFPGLLSKDYFHLTLAYPHFLGKKGPEVFIGLPTFWGCGDSDLEPSILKTNDLITGRSGLDKDLQYTDWKRFILSRYQFLFMNCSF